MGEDMCVVCGVQVESTEHVFRDCSLAKAVWFQSLGLRVDNGGDQMSLVQWLVSSVQQIPIVGFELCLMFL